MGGGQGEATSLATLSILQEISYWATEVTRLQRLKEQVTCTRVKNCLDGYGIQYIQYTYICTYV
jgi:hypothetical protein